LAVNPYESASSIQIIPSPRYAIMTQYFQELGGRGLDMMRLTSGCHVNLDYWSAKHGIQQMRVGAYLAPVFIACFGNSPFFERKSTGRFAERIAIWQKTDALRSGIPPGLFDSAFNMSSYVNLVESTPLMFYFDENGVAHPAAGRAWQDLSSALQETNALTAIRQLFYDVRLKPCCVELRFLDQNEPSVRMASFALMLGLLQDEKNLQELDQEASRATIENVLRATDLASKKALTEHSFVLQAQSLLKRAELGLWRRGFGEEKFLAPLDQILKNRKNPAQTLLEEGGFERFEENSIRRRSR
jgi:glutamate--cysteine ligase